MIRVGTILHGYCGGAFGRESYSDKRVEAIGADWVVAREEDTGNPVFAEFTDANSSPDDLEAPEPERT